MAFAGQYEDGSDDYYDYSGMNADEIEKYLPEELDQYFGISETVSQWEEENNEETVDNIDD
jgi:flagellar biosynthesis/type III secretory pathway ATPase